MNGPMQPGMPAGGQQQQLQFGPESLIALLMSMMQGGPQSMGPAAGNATAVGQGSMASLLPQLMQSMQPQQPPQAVGPPGTPGAGGGGGAKLPGGQQPSTPGQPGQGQQPPFMQQIMQMLSSLGLGGGMRGGQAPNSWSGGGSQ